SNEEVKKQRNRAAIKNKQYFLFPHRLKNGEIKFVDLYSSPIEINDRQYLFSIITDVTKREQNEIELYKEKELQRITMDSIADCVVTTDEQGRITYLNNAAAIAAEWKQAEVIGKYFNEIFPMTNEYTQDTVPNIVEAVLKTSHKQELANHTMLHTKSGNKIPIEDSAAPILDKNGKRYGAVVIFRDVTAAKEKKKKIKYLSYHDALTGLYNRNFYYDYIDHSNNTGIYPLGYIIGDVNGLKMTNDVFGHTMGDNLLKTVSDILQKTADTNDRVIRWGGDEFIIVVPHADRKHLESLIVKIKSDLKSITITDGIEASVSFGMSIKQHKWISTDDILKEAEEMMYQTKL
ncbi:MAG TPA: diguanylate cyclase, partial [Lachnospiraceae bacterium]|nr:diguanylate cyclase [Lachnospiraceae bacterium]